MKKLLKLITTLSVIVILCALNISMLEFTSFKDLSLRSSFKAANAGCEDSIENFDIAKKCDMTCPTGDGGTFDTHCCDDGYSTGLSCEGRPCD